MLDLAEFERGSILLFAAPAVLWVVVMSLGSAVRFRRGGRWILAASRAVLVTALFVSLAEPVVRLETTTPARLEILVDRSRSLGPEAGAGFLEATSRMIATIRDSGLPTELTLAAFARRPRLLYSGPIADCPVEGLLAEVSRDGFAADLDPLASRLQPALNLLAADRRSDVRPTTIVFSDGAVEAPPTAGAPNPGPAFLVVPSREASRGSRAVSADGPRRITTEEPLTFRLAYESTEARDAELQVLVDGKEVKRSSVRLQAGAAALDFGGKDLLLPEGLHEVSVRLDSGDEEPADDTAGFAVQVHRRRRVAYVVGSPDPAREPAPLRALRAQDQDPMTTTPEGLPALLADPEAISAVILDRVPPQLISDPVGEAIVGLVRSGRGLLCFPRALPGEFRALEATPLGAVLPFTPLPDPPPGPDQPKPKPEPESPPPEKLADPDPAKSRNETIDAPTLIMMIVIDKSASMKEGSRLHFAKRGAVATVRRLHPLDRIGVISYNSDPTEVVPIRRAEDVEEIERAIMRIDADGSTDIEKALRFARVSLEREEAAVKTIVLLSDGESIPFPIRQVCEEIVASGISINTIGVAPFDRSTLTQIAKYGRGTGPIPVYKGSDIPAVMVDVASRIMKDNKTRTADDARPPEKKDPEIVRPENLVDTPRPPTPADVGSGPDAGGRRLPLSIKRPVSYLDGMVFSQAPALSGIHPVLPRSAAWVALVADGVSPFLAHLRVGEGIVAAWATPPEGEWSGGLSLWESYPALIAQVVDFIEQERPQERIEIRMDADADRALVHAEDSWSRRDDRAFRLELSSAGQPLPATTEVLGGGEFLLRPARDPEGRFLRVEATLADDAAARGRTAAFIPPPAEIRDRGVDLRRLGDWSRHLGAAIETCRADFLPPAPTPGRSRSSRPVDLPIAAILLVGFLVELVLKRGLRLETLG